MEFTLQFTPCPRWRMVESYNVSEILNLDFSILWFVVCNLNWTITIRRVVIKYHHKVWNINVPSFFNFNSALKINSCSCLIFWKQHTPNQSSQKHQQTSNSPNWHHFSIEWFRGTHKCYLQRFALFTCKLDRNNVSHCWHRVRKLHRRGASVRLLLLLLLLRENRCW